MKHFASDFGPRQPGLEPDLAVLFARLRPETNRSEQFFDQFAFNNSVISCRVFRRQHATRKLSENRRDLSLKAAHPSLARIKLSDRLYTFFGEVYLFLCKAICFELFQKQMSPSNLELLAFCVARKPDDLKPVLKRRRNRVQHVRRRYEHHIRKIILDIQIMIVKCEVLLRVKDFKQRCRWIATKIHSKLIDFIQHYQRVYCPRLLHHLNNLTRQSADVSAAVPSYFRFIANAAKTKAHKLATGCFGNRTTETGLAHARRSNEA